MLTLALIAGCIPSSDPAAEAPAGQTAEQADAGLVPGHVVVIVGADASLPAVLDDAIGGSIRLLDTLPELRAAVLGVPLGREAAAIAQLQHDPRIVSAQRSAVLSTLTVPDDPIYKEFQWGVRKIGMETVWDVTTGSPDVIVAVLDTGVDEAHPDLEPNVIDGYDFVNDDPDAWDDSSHGTHVAGVIAAVGDNDEGTAGMTWRSKIMPIKVLDAKGLGPDAAVSKGIIYAVENKARIINLSSGTPYQSKLLDDAVKFAERRGVLVVAAAGNTGDKGNEVIYPAAYANVLAVGATDEKDQAPPFSQRQPYVAIAAPGVDIPGPAWRDAGNGPYILHTGTSAAAPHVSGLAALLLSIQPTLSPQQIRDIIIGTADQVNPRSRDAFLGAGRINALKAVNSLRPIPVPTRPVIRPTATPERLPGTPAVPQAPRIVLPSIKPLPQPGPLPEEPISWFFAEGNTTAGFETWLTIQNPMPAPASARVTFMTQDGPVARQTVVVPPSSRKSLHVNEIVPGALVATRVDSNTPVFAERTVYFGHDAIGGIGTRSGARSWYLAEGSTQPPFDTWILLLNPNDEETVAHLTFMLENGGTIEATQPLPPQSRVSFDSNDVIESAGFATEVRADLPIVVERSMYFGSGGGHGTIGVKTPGKTWFLAEGDSRPGVDTWILLQNPSATDVANVSVTFIKDDGTTEVAYYALDPRTRLSLFADTVVPNTTFGARIDADQQIIVERSIYLANGAGGHASAAVQIPETEWFLPEGSTRAPYREIIAILNPSPEQTQVDLTFTQPDGQPPVTQSFVMEPTSRLSVEANKYVPDADISTRVIADHPVVVERSMYWERGATSSPGLTR
ncbi:MAG: S8 family serine peptidase [Chloroflexi bacterium]|nr:S8 family serine peptidase [Chloroflexota bacterium]